jgi:hypothetical protein
VSLGVSLLTSSIIQRRFLNYTPGENYGEIYNFYSYYQDDKIKDDGIGGVCRAHEKTRNANTPLVVKPEGKRPLESHTCG